MTASVGAGKLIELNSSSCQHPPAQIWKARLRFRSRVDTESTSVVFGLSQTTPPAPGNLAENNDLATTSRTQRLDYMIPVVDLFAGPGGLNEGFSSVGEDDGSPRFETVASFEMDTHAHQTLLLRGVYRKLKRTGEIPQSYYDFVSGKLTWEEFAGGELIEPILDSVSREVHQLELGPINRQTTDARIRTALAGTDGHIPSQWVLVGGPPCQAYSLAGRARRTNDKDFEKDKKHFLYREYLHIIEEFEPSIFVMENVKGLLSSTHAGSKMFEKILGDLSRPKDGLEYEVRSLVVPGRPDTLRPKDFVVRAEDYGVPQKRHRIILVGIRKDLVRSVGNHTLVATPSVSVRDAIEDLPKIRSAIAPHVGNVWSQWASARKEALALARKKSDFKSAPGRPSKLDVGSAFMRVYRPRAAQNEYERWTLDAKLGGISLHEARRHMVSDLKRYAYLAAIASKLERNPTLLDLPPELQPAHLNVGRPDTPFTDRFRVQHWDTPASTVVSHIAKDGHYYIHPDFVQMRSLTVREAARLQSFPDNYFFRGTRTQQYSQVGNAVPPLLASKIATLVAEMFDEIENASKLGESVASNAVEPISTRAGQDLQKATALAL